MPLSNQKVERFTEKVLQEAINENDAAMSVFNEKRAAAIDSAKNQAEADSRSYVYHEIGRIRVEAGKRIASKMQENKRTLFIRRGQISADVFLAVRNRIASYTATEQYALRMEKLLSDALKALNGAAGIRVYIRPADKGLIDRLKKLAAQNDVTFLDGGFKLGGLIAEAGGKGMRIDSSFDSRMEELSGRFAEIFGISLADDEE